MVTSQKHTPRRRSTQCVISPRPQITSTRRKEPCSQASAMNSRELSQPFADGVRPSSREGGAASHTGSKQRIRTRRSAPCSNPRAAAARGGSCSAGWPAFIGSPSTAETALAAAENPPAIGRSRKGQRRCPIPVCELPAPAHPRSRALFARASAERCPRCGDSPIPTLDGRD